MVQRLGPRHTMRLTADHDGQLALEIELLGDGGTDYRLPIADDAVRETHEHDRVLGNLSPHFVDVRSVVHSDTEYLANAV